MFKHQKNNLFEITKLNLIPLISYLKQVSLKEKNICSNNKNLFDSNKKFYCSYLNKGLVSEKKSLNAMV